MNRYLLIGGGIAAWQALCEIQRHDPKGEITVICDEHRSFYYRAALSRLLTQQLELSDLPFYSDDRIKNVRFIQDMARSVDRDKRRVTTLTGHEAYYDKLLLATGSTPVLPRVPGRSLRGVFTFRTLLSAQSLAERFGREEKVLVVGGGVLGLEVAWAAIQTGSKTTLLVREDHLGAPLLDKKSAEVVFDRVKEAGVTVIFEDVVERFVGDGDRLIECYTTGGKILEIDTAVCCMGTTPNMNLARKLHLPIERGILVDEKMRTDAEDIYAAGDCCEVKDEFSGNLRLCRHWSQAALQGQAAGANMAGQELPYTPGPFFNAGLFFDLRYALYGDWKGESAGSQIIESKASKGRFGRLVLKDGQLQGAVVIGSGQRDEILLELIKNRVDVSRDAKKLFAPSTDLGAILRAHKSAQSGPEQLFE